MSKTVTWDGTPKTVTFTYADDCVDGDPAFTAVPTLLGAPIVASVEDAGAQILTHYVTVSTNLLITMELAYTDGTDTVQIEFGVAGPV